MIGNDRLYELLPIVHRRRDAEKGYPLKALLRVIAEQVNIVEGDIEHLYDNWFIETCEDWAVPYIGDLIGYRRVNEAGMPGDVDGVRARLRNRILMPRREVAMTVPMRRRKGTLAILEELARNVAQWPARAVEFGKYVALTQSVNHVRLARGRTISLREMNRLDLIHGRRLEPESSERLEPAETQHERLISHGAFDTLSHSVDVRRIDSLRTPGRYNLPDIGLFVFRLKSYPICKSQALAQRFASHCFTFSPLGNDVPLFIKSVREDDPTDIAGEINLPVPLRRRALVDSQADEPRHASTDFYGEGKSLAIWTGDWSGHLDEDEPVPATQVIPADLSDWEGYLPAKDTVAVDPVLGRIVFPPKQFPRSGVWVSYHYGFSADMAGGQTDRSLSAPDCAYIYRVGRKEEFETIGDAKSAWQDEGPSDAVIEISDNCTYREPINFELGGGQSLQLRAKVGCRPVISVADSTKWATVSGQDKSRFTLDGILFTGLPMNIEGNLAELTIRHSTLLPGSTIGHDCKPDRPSEPSLVLLKTKSKVNIEHSIVGSIQVKQDEVSDDPITIRLADSILDATDAEEEAIGSDAGLLAHAILTFERSTVIGYVETHAIDLAENSIFLGRVTVGRRQRGCMRFCYVDTRIHDLKGHCSRTPRRYRCQPDLAITKLTECVRQKLSSEPGWNALSPDQQKARFQAELERLLPSERLRLVPTFNALRYGLPTYCQLSESCAPEIRQGADDDSEMGVFHDLFEPQRRDVLDARLDEFTPADSDAGIIYAT